MNATSKSTRAKLVQMVQMAILAALVIVLQLIGSFIHIGPTSVSLVLIPIALGAMLFGPVGGGVLGFIFGLMTLMAGVTGTDVFTSILFNAHPLGTITICLGKATLAGVAGGFVFKWLKHYNSLIASFATAAIVPIVNTGLFILGGLTLVADTLKANFVGKGDTLIYFLAIGCAGLNFVAEFGFNLVLAPVLNRLIIILTTKMHHSPEAQSTEGQNAADSEESDLVNPYLAYGLLAAEVILILIIALIVARHHG